MSDLGEDAWGTGGLGLGLTGFRFRGLGRERQRERERERERGKEGLGPFRGSLSSGLNGPNPKPLIRPCATCSRTKIPSPC